MILNSQLNEIPADIHHFRNIMHPSEKTDMRALLHCMITFLILTTYQSNGQVYHLHRLDEPSRHKEQLRKEEDTIRDLIVEQMPLFPGCIDTALTSDQKYKCSQKKLQEYISSNLLYPTEGLNRHIEGHVVVEFVVELDGRMSHIKAINDIGGGCAEEAVRIIESINTLNARWAPALQRGIPVRVVQRVAVTFEAATTRKKKNLHPSIHN